MPSTRRSGALQSATPDPASTADAPALPVARARMTRSRPSDAKPATTPASATVRTRGQLSKTAAQKSESASPAPTLTNYSSGSGYSTPLTSNVVTPAPSFLADALAAPKSLGAKMEINIPAAPPVFAKSSTKVLKQSKYALNPVSKRKRYTIGDSEDDEDDEYDDIDMSVDAKLARRLQDEEYEQGEAGPSSSRAPIPASQYPQRTRGRAGLSSLNGQMPVLLPKPQAPLSGSKVEGKGKAVKINDSDEDEDQLSVLGDSESDEVISTPFRKKRKTRAAATFQPKPSASVVDSDDDGSTFGTSVQSETSENFDSDDATPAPDPASAQGTTGAARTTTARRRQTRNTRINVSRRAFRGYRNKKKARTDKELLEEQHPILKTMWEDLEKMPVLKVGKVQQPKTISRILKPFQLEGVAWMMAMEETRFRGGLLGDEMGLGKTIQAVSLIMSDYPAKKPSLVLAPPVALMQWMSEINSYTDGTLKTIVYHGTNAKSKNLTVKDLKGFDVIIMSYNSLESMYRKQEKGFTRKDGIYKEKSIVHQTHFHRVILDEAHSIKTRTTMTAKACFALNTDNRWCLTGTPLQNRIGEFFSLVRFLQVDPFSSYLCRDCKCTKLEWAMNEDNICPECGHRGMRHVSVFNQELLNPIQRYGNTGVGADAFRKLRLMTDRIMLRRLKKDHTDSMELPVKEIIVDRQFFGEEENDFANSIMTNGQRKFDTYVAQGVLLNNYANIFGLIMQMRQVADHPDLILKKDSEGGQNVLVCCICDEPAEEAIRSKCKHDFCRDCAKSYLNSSEQPDCPRCHIPLAIDLEQPEIEQDMDLMKKKSIINRIKMENWTSSSKIELLVHDLHKLRSDNTSHKSIIFSQFTTMLQLVEWRLRRAGITTVMLDGSMTPAQRQASIERFMTDVDIECFLVSLKAGGVALNLTEASRVFIVDPWWNPAAEWQSADRCHRIGQTRPCTITRLCIEDSVESRMVLLQEKKAKMINSTINSDDAAMESLTPDDLQFLFRGN